MLREFSEDIRIRVKDRLRDFRLVVRQHRHDSTHARPRAAGPDKPFPVRGIEDLLSHAASAFDDVMTLAQSLAPLPGASQAVLAGPRPLQAYFRTGDDTDIGGERAFRRDLYSLAKLALEKKRLHDVRILESDFASVHEALRESSAIPLARLGDETDRDARVGLVAGLAAAIFLELVRHQPIRLPEASGTGASDAATQALAAIAIAAGLATLDMEGSAGAELMEIATLAVEARGGRIRAALDSENPVGDLISLFQSLLVHLN